MCYQTSFRTLLAATFVYALTSAAPLPSNSTSNDLTPPLDVHQQCTLKPVIHLTQSPDLTLPPPTPPLNASSLSVPAGSSGAYPMNCRALLYSLSSSRSISADAWHSRRIYYSHEPGPGIHPTPRTWTVGTCALQLDTVGGRFVEDSATGEEVWRAVGSVVGVCLREEGRSQQWWGGEQTVGETGRLIVRLGRRGDFRGAQAEAAAEV